MSFLTVRDVSMVFPAKEGDSFQAIDRISLNVEKNEFVCLIGHSGCGKSTLLNLIAGLMLPSSGEIQCEGVKIRGPGPDRAMVFQSHALLPWMTCLRERPSRRQAGLRPQACPSRAPREDRSRVGSCPPRSCHASLPL